MTVCLKIPFSIKNCTMYKAAHHLVNQFNVLVSTQRGSLPKVTSGQALLTSLLPHYFLDFIVVLLLVFGVIICQVVFVTMSTFAYNLVCLLKMLSCLCILFVLIFRLEITSIVLLLCCMTDVSLEFPTIYQHFSFVTLVSRFH